MFSLETLGGLDLRDADGRDVSTLLSQPRLLSLLVYLAGSSFRSRDALIYLIWPETPEATARHRLNQMLYELRRAFSGLLPVSRGKEEIGIPHGALRFDALDFREAIAEGRRREALALYRGPFLEGFGSSRAPGIDRWIDEQRELLRRMAWEAASTLCEELEASGAIVETVVFARKALEISPLSESTLQRLLRLLIAVGDRSSALDTYAHFERRLALEWELAPSAATAEIVDELISTSAPVLATTPEPAPLPVLRGEPSPFPSAGPAVDAEGARRTATAALGVGLAAVVGLGAWASGLLPEPTSAPRGPAPETTPVVAVMPIETTGEVPQAFGDLGAALTRELVTRLGRTPGLLVVPTSVTEGAMPTPASAVELGRRLEADAVVAGSLEWDGSGIETVAEVIDVESGETLWSVQHDHAHRELLSAQRDITVGVTSALRSDPTLVPAPDDIFASEEELAAWAYVQQARSELELRPLDRIAVRDLLARALELAPDYGPAYAVRSLELRRRWQDDMLERQWLDSALVMAERAVSLEPDATLSQYALAQALVVNVTPEPPSLERLRRRLEASVRAVQLNPSDPDAVRLLTRGTLGVGRNLLWGERAWRLTRGFTSLYQQRARWLLTLGDHGGSLAAWRRVAELSPRTANPDLRASRIAEVHLSRGDFASARRALEASGTAGPEHVSAFPAAIYLDLAEERYESAERLILELLAQDPPVERINSSNFDTPSALGFVYLKTGRQREGDELLRARRERWVGFHQTTGVAYVGAYNIARLSSMLGESDEAVRWMATAIEKGWHFYYAGLGPADPMLERVRDDPRFLELMDGLREELDAERAWVHRMMELPDQERLRAMLDDAGAQLDAAWEAPEP